MERIKKLSLESKLHWHVRYAPNTGTYYAMASKRIDTEDGKRKGESVYLHVEIMNPEHNKNIYIDHFNHDTLNNTKINLRRTENKKNLRHRKGANSNNSTGHRNVNRSNDPNILWVQFMKNGQRYKWDFLVNQYDEACKFADIKRQELFGEYSGNS